LDRTGDFQKFVDQVWIGLNCFEFGLD